jgi:hypothetical protein
MGRIEHTLVDGAGYFHPTDLRPPPAPTPYHKKLRMFQSVADYRSAGQGFTSGLRPLSFASITFGAGHRLGDSLLNPAARPISS